MTMTNGRRKTFRPGSWAAAALALLGLLTFWACHLSPADEKDTFDVVGDSTWTHCNTVMIILKDKDDKVLDTLFNDSLKSIDQLKNLDASKYQGGSGSIIIKGLFKDGGICFDQTRKFQEGGKDVKVDTILDPNVIPTGLKVEPKDLVLTMGSPAATLNAEVTPSYADGSVSWSVDGSGVVALEGLADGKGNPARVKPLKAGIGSIKVRSLRDTALTFTVPVRVLDPGKGSIDIEKDTVVLYVKGDGDSLKVVIPPEYAGQKLEWKTGNIDVATVDAQGRIKPVKEGETNVQATLQPAGLTDVALVQVRLDKPVLKVDAPKGVGVGGSILFSAVVTQKFGTIVLFKYDLLGEGKFDSLTVGWSGDSVNLPAVGAKYEKEGQVTAKFIVKDSEGNITETTVLLDIGNQAPVILTIRADTVISVKDSIAMSASAKDSDGKVVSLGWDYEGDGQFDDTASFDAAEAKLEKGHRFHEAGTYKAVFRARDNNGKSSLDTAIVKVEFDAPVADAGPDQTVLAGAPVTIPVKGTDKFGRIVKREIKVGDNAFITLPDGKEEVTQNAPDKPVTVRFIIRVTDDDSLSDLDTAEVTVILSSNADLTDLTFSGGALTPTFTPNAKSYQARVAFADSLVSVIPKVRDGGTKISVNGETVESGKPSRTVKLTLGRNVDAFEIITTAADGTQREYKVTVTRDPNGEATLGKLDVPGFNLAPAFAPTTLDYADTVPYEMSTVTFKPTVASAGATLAFNDTAMTSGTFTAPRPLDFKENVFTFKVTAMDGLTKSTYTVKILRLGRLVVLRKLGGGTASVVDSSDMTVGTSRTVSGATPTGWKFVKWSTLEGSAALADSAANPTQATLNSGLAKVQANFEILKYTITTSASGCGKVDPGTVTLDHSANQSFALIPADGCRIQSVKVDGKEDTTGYDGKLSFATVIANHTLDVVFVRTFTLSVKVDGNGEVSPQSVTVDSGAKVTFTAKAAEGHKVAANGICDEIMTCINPAKDGTFGVESANANKGYTVSFVPGWRIQGTLTGGIGTLTPLDTVVDNLANVSWLWTLDPRYRLIDLLLDKTPVKPTAAGTLALTAVAANHHLQVVLIRRYAMTYDLGPGGTLSSQPVTVDSMATPQFIATPTAGYRVDTLEVNGTAISAIGGSHAAKTFTLAAVTGPTTVKVRFKRYYTFNTKLGGGATISPEAVNVDSGATQQWTLTFTEGYRVTALDIQGTNSRSLLPNLSGAILTLTNVAEEGTITGGFSNLYTIRLTSNLAKGLNVPNLCIEHPAGLTCDLKGTGLIDVQLAYGTGFAIGAPSNVPGEGRLSYNFHYWTYGKGPMTVCVSSLKETVGGSMTFSAFYSTALPPGPEKCPSPF